jgi:hypothetical protein
MFLVVPDSLRAAIDAKLDAALKETPDAARDREHLYRQLLLFFHENGFLPDFTLKKGPKDDGRH